MERITIYKSWEQPSNRSFHPLRARRALSLFKDAPLRTRKALLLYKVYMVIAPFWLSTADLTLNWQEVQAQLIKVLLFLSAKEWKWATEAKLVLPGPKSKRQYKGLTFVQLVLISFPKRYIDPKMDRRWATEIKWSAVPCTAIHRFWLGLYERQHFALHNRMYFKLNFQGMFLPFECSFINYSVKRLKFAKGQYARVYHIFSNRIPNVWHAFSFLWKD